MRSMRESATVFMQVEQVGRLRPVLSDAQHGTRAWKGPCEARVPAWAYRLGAARMRNVRNPVIALAIILTAWPALGAEVKVLTSGAFKPIVMAVVPAFQSRSGDTAVVANDTVGALVPEPSSQSR